MILVRRGARQSRDEKQGKRKEKKFKRRGRRELKGERKKRHQDERGRREGGEVRRRRLEGRAGPQAGVGGRVRGGRRGATCVRFGGVRV